MARSWGWSSSRSSRPLALIAGGIVALVALDVALIVLALDQGRSTAAGPAGPVPTFSSTPFPAVSATPDPTPSASAAQAATGRSERLLVAVDGRTAWRATAGRCDAEPGSLERTTNGGSDWQRVDVGDSGGAVVGLTADRTGVAVALRSGDDCALRVERSQDDGSTWRAAAPGAAGAVLDGTDLLLSGGRTASPCAGPDQVYEGTATTTVVCDDGSVRWRSGTGSWVRVAAPGVQALADAGDSYVLARTAVDGCDGVRVDSLTAIGVRSTTTPSALGCLVLETGPPRDTAVSWADGTAWVWSGDDVRRSEDGGTTW